MLFSSLTWSVHSSTGRRRIFLGVGAIFRTAREACPKRQEKIRLFWYLRISSSRRQRILFFTLSHPITKGPSIADKSLQPLNIWWCKRSCSFFFIAQNVGNHKGIFYTCFCWLNVEVPKPIHLKGIEYFNLIFLIYKDHTGETSNGQLPPSPE